VARFYLDEDVSERLLAPLQVKGHEATSAGKLQHKGLSDARQLLYAAQSQRALVTHNAKDYILLQDAWKSWATAWNALPAARHAGLLIVYTSKGLNATIIADEIDRFVTSTNDLGNRLFAWHLADGWTEIG
jgi:hypothetical protein